MPSSRPIPGNPWLHDMRPIEGRPPMCVSRSLIDAHQDDPIEPPGAGFLKLGWPHCDGVKSGCQNQGAFLPELRFEGALPQYHRARFGGQAADRSRRFPAGAMRKPRRTRGVVR